WVWGTKHEFLSKRKSIWLAVVQDKTTGPFYTKMAKLFVLKYGYDLADDEDFEYDVEDPPDAAADIVVYEALAPEEAAFRTEYKKKLRAVRIIFVMPAWREANALYGSLLKSDKAAFSELFTGVLDGAPPKPQRPKIVNFFSRKFYDTLVKSRFDDRMASLTRRKARTGEEVPAEIQVRNAVTKEVWDEQTFAFRADVELSMEREHEVAMVGWKASLADSPTRTPQEIAASLENAAFYLQPFVDAIEQRFGMCVSVLLCGPIGKLGGAIGMQSVHAGVTKGLAPTDWPKFDRVGFAEVEKHMISFAR
ncbi:hypothetical protein B0H11DRAFT_1691506, partial [Mycena galericulata]